MDGSMGMGFMAVFAVSGSVALLALQVHKRLLTDFMKRIEFEIGSERCQHKKRVRNAQNGGKQPLPSCERESCRTSLEKPCMKRRYQGLEGTMPLNRLALYKGIIEYRNHFPKKEYGVSSGRNASHVHIRSH